MSHLSADTQLRYNLRVQARAKGYDPADLEQLGEFAALLADKGRYGDAAEVLAMANGR